MNLPLIVEESTAEDDSSFVENLLVLEPNESFEVYRFDGGACMIGPAPFSNTFGFGTSDEQIPLLDSIEEFFRDRDHPSTITITSESAYPFIDSLRERGYGLCNFSPLFSYCSTGEIRKTSKFSDIEILEATTPEGIAEWARVVSGGFSNQEPCEPDIIARGQATKKGNRLFLAKVDGEIAAGSSLYLHKDFARLGGMATIPRFRRRGIQQKMIQHRVEVALAADCRTIVSECMQGSSSANNLERADFKLAYVRATFQQPR